MVIIAFDSHKRYTQACVEQADGKRICEQRIEHGRGKIEAFLSSFERGSAVAIETIGNWYWLVDEIEAAGMEPRLVHAHKAKLMLGCVNKTDKLDARGLNRLQRCGTLPTVWIPPGELRDKRELARTRMVFATERTRLKNRIHAVLAKYGLQDEFGDLSDIFGKQGRRLLASVKMRLPVETQFTMERLLESLDQVEAQIGTLERRMCKVFGKTEEVRRLMTLPGVGFILATVIWQEIGDIERFGSAERLASYAGTCPRIHSSGDKSRFGPLRKDVNHYLKWAFSEAGNSISLNWKRSRHNHITQLYTRLRFRRGHAKAIGAVARQLAQASYWMLKRKEDYKEPKETGSSTEA
jgi:transposase